MIINNAFALKQVVYLVTDADQRAGLVTAIKVTVNGLMYEVTIGFDADYYYDFEIQENKAFIN